MSHEMNATSIIGDTNGDKLAKKSFKEKMTDLKEAITVEPIVACYQMAISLSKPALDNLEFEKSCRVNLEYNDTICNAILSGNRGDYEEENARVQTVISVMHSWQQPIGSFMPLVLVLFLGSFSDRHKLRKPFLLMPIIGEIFGNAGCIICVIFMRQLPLQAQGVLQKVVPSFFGGQVMLVMASTSHIADVTSNEARTLRLGIVQIVISVTVLLVQPLSGFIFVKSGYLSVLITAALLNTAALMYCAFWIREKSCASQDTEKSILIDVFNPEHALDTFKFPFKKNPGNDRILIGLFILTVFVYRCAYEGESSLLFLYTQNMFEWTPLEFSYFLTANSLVSLIGHLCAMPLLAKVLGWNDFAITFIAILDKIICNLIFGLAKTITAFYTGVATSILVRVYTTVKKSIATKIVPTADIGKAQSFLGICETLAPAISVPVYNRLIYVNILQTFPAGFYYFSALLYTFCCISVVCMYQLESKRKGHHNLEKKP
ncbi:uncharacterized protein LOC132695879 isoform X2 [Cylas formicarius]|uniref:uncharacterized protein LOC132695879 isoform X2 n=1 Tax=Cylas formicarius TaxID=197179 RepID=UPI002958910A|nr:uncharacterized protein LOC132695879 isoform X2 [Cylas formicarius]